MRNVCHLSSKNPYQAKKKHELEDHDTLPDFSSGKSKHEKANLATVMLRH